MSTTKLVLNQELWTEKGQIKLSQKVLEVSDTRVK